MAALLGDPAVLDHEDRVGLADRREPVGDHERGAALERGRERLLHGGLGLAVEVRGGLVEHDDVGRLEQQPRDGHALLLAAGEAVAAVADDRVETVGQRPRRASSTCASRSAAWSSLVGGAGAGVEQVGADRVVEHVRVLRHDADERRAATPG